MSSILTGFLIFKKRGILNCKAFIQLLSTLLTLPVETFGCLKVRFLPATPSLLPWAIFSIYLASACALANEVKPSADALKAYPAPGSSNFQWPLARVSL